MVKQTIKIFLIIIVVLLNIFHIVHHALDGIPFKGEIHEEHVVRFRHTIHLRELVEYDRIDEWYKKGHILGYVNKDFPGAHCFDSQDENELIHHAEVFLSREVDTEKLLKKAAIYSNYPQMVLRDVAPSAKIQDVEIISNRYNELMIYYKPDKGEFLYYQDYLNDSEKEYLFTIEKAYEISKFMNENAHSDGENNIDKTNWPLAKEYEGIEDFEIKTYEKLYYIGIILQSVCALLVITAVSVLIAMMGLRRQGKRNFCNVDGAHETGVSTEKGR